MDLKDYAADSVTISERYLTMSDGVGLRVFDFVPADDDVRQPVVVFVAGWISLISGWQGFLKQLSATHRVLYVESREKFSSRVDDINSTAFDLPRVTLDVQEVLEQGVTRGRPFVLSGSSLGATAIMEYLMTHQGPQPMGNALIAPNPELRFPAPIMAIIRLFPPAAYPPVKAFAKWYLRTFRLDAEKEPEQVAKYENTLDQADPYKLKKNVFALMKYRAWGRMHNITQDCLIIGASADKLHGLENLERMIAEMPNARLEAMESNKATHGAGAADIVVDYIRGLA
jgi:pimeloyl-ACP methyl ester carboxylesterase